MTYAEFKRLDTYKTATSVEIVNENGIKINNEIPEKKLNAMDVKGYFIKDGYLTLELGESIEEFDY